MMSPLKENPEGPPVKIGPNVEARCGFKPLSLQEEYRKLEFQPMVDASTATLDGAIGHYNPVADSSEKSPI